MEIQAIIPTLFSPFGGELIVFGLSLRTSDYGDGAFDVRAFMLRPACANGMIADSVLRQVHVGKRIGDDVTLSQKTMDLDTATIASATNDIVRNALSPASIDMRLRQLKAAHEDQIDPDSRSINTRLRARLTKAETEAVVAHFKSPDVVTLTPGPTALRMANAISWLANSTTGDDRHRQALQEVAGSFLPAAVAAS
jgi:hypothetical protein